jgi:D-beta-D-heptose 7-phosphate kinase/D-beta-D-heptose 1-phosphate adenosyltransferase
LKVDSDTAGRSLSEARSEELLTGFARLRLLVVGDVFLDEYLSGDAERVSPEAPVPIVRVRGEAHLLGGAANVVRNVVALGASCELCSVIGPDVAGDRVVGLLDELGVGTRGLLRSQERATTLKTRIVARRQQIVRVDRETVAPLSGSDASRLLASVARVSPDVQGVILEDYAKGLLTRETALPIMREAARLHLPVSVDPKIDLAPFAGASLVKPNLAEAQAISGLDASGPGGLEAIARRLQKIVGGGDVAITLGREGMEIFEGAASPVRVPTVARDVFDVQGAGDTIVAALSLALRAGASLWEAAVLANAAAAVVVRKTGTATATRDELREVIPAVREVAQLALRSDGGSVHGSDEESGS